MKPQHYEVFHIKATRGSALLCGNTTGKWIVVELRTITREQLVMKGVCTKCADLVLALRVDEALTKTDSFDASKWVKNTNNSPHTWMVLKTPGGE